MAPLSVLILIGGMVAGTALVLRTPALPRSTPGSHATERRRVRVVIPARDEADVLPALLADLADQTTPVDRVIVVDDGSRDATAAVAAAWPGVEVRSATPPPPGWNPKTWALCHGISDPGAGDDRADPADPEVLVFIDADVRLAPDALASVLAVRHQRGGVVSVAPRHDVGSAIEALSLPFNLVAVMGAGKGLTARHPEARAAFGPCVAVDRRSYQRFGGHEADRGDLLDDVALAARARRAGVAVSLLRGGDLVRYRMYRGGGRVLVDGWTKNIAAGATRTAAPTALAVALWITAVLIPLVELASARTAGQLAGAAGAWAAVGLHTAVLARQVGRFPLAAAAAAPLLGLAFVAVVARSALALALGRSVRWKDRELVAARGSATGG